MDNQLIQLGQQLVPGLPARVAGALAQYIQENPQIIRQGASAIQEWIVNNAPELRSQAWHMASGAGERLQTIGNAIGNIAHEVVHGGND